MGTRIMKMRWLFVTFFALCSVAAASAQPIGWQKYVVPETGANVDLPNEIFSQDVGRPERGYGRAFKPVMGGPILP